MEFDAEEFVYVLINRSFPGMVKIGRTERDVEERVRELSAHTGVPTEFTVFKLFRVRNSADVERQVHLRLKEYRVSEGREFFAIEPDIAAAVVEELVGSSSNPSFDIDREDDLMARATNIAGSFGALWPSMLAARIDITHAEAEQIVQKLVGRGLLDQSGKATFSRPRAAETERPTITPAEAGEYPVNYQFPPLNLLQEADWSVATNEKEFRDKAFALFRVFEPFGIKALLDKICVGPNAARFQFSCEKLLESDAPERIEDEITASLKYTGARVVGSIPGKIGFSVDVQNAAPKAVVLRHVVESETWANFRSSVPIGIGMDSGGVPFVIDLAKANLLLAGARSSELMMALRTIFASMLLSKSPMDVRLIVIDPTLTLTELGVLPHMLLPVVREPRKASAVLAWMLEELAMRFQLFAKVGVSTIEGFNRRSPAAAIRESGEIEIPDRVPHLVVVISEIFDLMVSGDGNFGKLLTQLVLHSNASGIHVVLCTQRPDAGTLEQPLMDALPVRAAFRMTSQLDSRRFLGLRGAECLNGLGEMIWIQPSHSLERVQVAAVSEEEFTSMVQFMRRNGPPVYAQWVQQQIDRAAREDDDEDDENAIDESDDAELFSTALDVLKATRRASTSMLQRRLRIGYNRACRIFELFEEKGIVGPEDGQGQRQILVDLDRI